MASDNTTHQVTHETIKRLDHAHLWHPFTPMQLWFEDDPVVIVAATGHELIDDNGKHYLDGVSSLWCNVHGHNRPELNAAITDQLQRVAHTTLLGLTNVPAVLLAERLSSLVPAGLTRVFYSDAGATAVEAALKMTLQFWQLSGQPSKTRFGSLVDAYHGDTLGAVGVGYADTFHRFYRTVLPDTLRLTPPHLLRWRNRLSQTEALEQAIAEATLNISEQADTLAAIIVEPLMQGAAGMWPHQPTYLRALRDITKKTDVLLIADEVATGFGRTGSMFACEQADITPDLLCLAKGITGGYLPLAATVATDEIHAAFLGSPQEGKTFFHGHTYTGNPVACAAALASLDLFISDQTLEKLGPKIVSLTQQLDHHIRPLPHVADVRQCGVMIGIELAADTETRTPYETSERMGAQVCLEARHRGVIIRPLGDVVVLMPPLSIHHSEIDRLISVVRDAIVAVTSGDCT